jgi:hypothetical protein
MEWAHLASLYLMRYSEARSALVTGGIRRMEARTHTELLMVSIRHRFLKDVPRSSLTTLGA